MIRNHTDLIVWQKAMDLVVLVYGITKSYPREEQFGLTSQIRRSVVSIPSNIAEGRSRGTRKDFRSFLLIAYGSANELQTQLEISRRLRFVAEEELKVIDELLLEVLKMLKSMIEKLRSSKADS